jgi:hypothetical protein
MLELHRLTSEYIESEDRLRLTGEDQQGNALCLWLTQRLALRMISHLVELIAKGSPEALQNPTHDDDANDLLQSFAQEAATSNIEPQQAVDSSKATKSVLVNEVDISRSPEGVVGFVFKSDTEQVALGFEAQQLRQWLTIIYAQWLLAEWPTQVWPQWITKKGSGRGSSTATTSQDVH